MQDTSHIACLDTLQGQGGDQGGTDTTAVFGSKDLNGILLLGVGLFGPVEDLAERLGAARLEVGVLVED